MSKRLGFIFGALTITWIGIEIIALIGHIVVSQTWFPKSRMRRDIEAVLNVARSEDPTLAGLNWEGIDYVEAVHPFFGYVPDPNTTDERYQVSPMGFLDPAGDLPLPLKGSDRIVVGFFGGSFARGTFEFARPGIADCLKATGKEIVVRNYSAGGYKQPQQLHILVHLLAIGAEFDVVINLDGFNEVALPIAENIPAGVHPLFPRRWHDRVAAFIPSARARKIGAIDLLEATKRRWAAPFDRFALYQSPTLALLWQARDRRLGAEIFELREALRLMSEIELALQFQQKGPAFSEGTKETYALLARFWGDASRQMAKISEANDARYLHLLQPNQYVADSKPMSDAERTSSIDAEHPYRVPVEEGYPLLAEEGQALERDGIAFHDLTRIYSDNPEPLYVDACCHVNGRGYEIVTEEICTVLTDLFLNEPAPTSQSEPSRPGSSRVSLQPREAHPDSH